MSQHEDSSTFEDVRLPRYFRWPLLGGLVLVFLFAGHAPVWRNPFDIDRAIWLSYAPIPLLVIVGLWLSQRLSVMTSLLNTMEIVLTKFALTYVIAIPLWATFEPSEAVASPPTRTPQDVVTAATSAPPAPTPWPRENVGDVTGTVETPDGRPVSGALVFVSAGLSDLDFPRPTSPTPVSLSASSFDGSTIVARKWQPLAIASSDGELHTFVLETNGRVQRNVPVLPSGAPTTTTVDAFDGVVSVRCTVHRTRAHVAVLHHGFHTETSASGAFTLGGIPARDITVSTWHRGTLASADVRIEAGEQQKMRLSVVPTPDDECPDSLKD